MSLPDRVWSRIDTTGDCWLWTGGVAGRGYAKTTMGGRNQYVHPFDRMDRGYRACSECANARKRTGRPVGRPRRAA